MDTFNMPMDAPDVGDYLSFSANKLLSDPKTWQYRYGLQFKSTYQLGGPGRCGDGDDIIVQLGHFQVPQEVIDAGEEEFFVKDFAEKNLPSIPPEVMTEYMNDFDLCEMDEMYVAHPDRYHSFEDIYFEMMGIYTPDDYDREEARNLEAWSHANGWEWNFS